MRLASGLKRVLLSVEAVVIGLFVLYGFVDFIETVARWVRSIF